MEKNSVYDLSSQEFNLKLAEALKKIPEFQEPEWAHYVKSSAAKERPIDDVDFWFKRSASILKQIYKNKAVGVNRLKVKYGSKKNRGMKPERFKKGSGKIIRTILQQCDKANFTELVEDKMKKGRKGRKLTDYGKKFLEDLE
jgi:small subunit ribosomal protein S19e